MGVQAVRKGILIFFAVSLEVQVVIMGVQENKSLKH